LAPWAPSKLYEQAIPASVRNAIRDRMAELGKPNPWAPPPDATSEQHAEFEAFQARMLVPDESITTWVDISGDPVERKWRALHEHATQFADDSFFLAFGLDGWREHWSKEAFILRESSVDSPTPEEDLFSGL
jgi:hypothetical protein